MENGNQKLEKKQGLIFLGILAITILCACLIIFPLVKKEDSHNKPEEETENLVDVISKNTEEEITVTKATEKHDQTKTNNVKVSINTNSVTKRRTVTARNGQIIQSWTEVINPIEPSQIHNKVSNNLLAEGFKQVDGSINQSNFINSRYVEVEVFYKNGNTRYTVPYSGNFKEDISLVLKLIDKIYEIRDSDALLAKTVTITNILNDENVSSLDFKYKNHSLTIFKSNDHFSFYFTLSNSSNNNYPDISPVRVGLTAKNNIASSKWESITDIYVLLMSDIIDRIKYSDYLLNRKNDFGGIQNIQISDNVKGYKYIYNLSDSVSLSNYIEKKSSGGNNHEISVLFSSYKFNDTYEQFITEDLKYFSKKSSNVSPSTTIINKVKEEIKTGEFAPIRIADNVTLQIEHIINKYKKDEYTFKYTINK